MQNIPEWQYHPNEDIIDRMRRRRQKCIMNLIIIAVNVILFLAAEATGGSENTVPREASSSSFVKPSTS